MIPDDKKALFAGAHVAVKEIAEFIKTEFVPVATKIILEPNCRDNCIRGYLLRTTAQMLTLAKLNHPEDVQAVCYCTRSLFEVLVDLIILLNDKTDDTAKKIQAWEDSAKLSSAEKTAAYYQGASKPIPDVFSVRQEFVNTDTQRIRLLRQEIWGKEKHPFRWSGHNRNLKDDVEDAERIHPGSVGYAVPMSLMEIYRTEYDLMNWVLHGSGFAAFRFTDDMFIIGLCALQYLACSDIALYCCKLIAIDYKLNDTMPELDAKGKELRAKRSFIIVTNLPSLKAEDSAQTKP